MTTAGYRVLDLETVPDLSCWEPPAPRWRLGPGPDGTCMPGGEVLAPAHVSLEEPFPPPHACRIVAAAWVDLSADDGAFYCFRQATVISRWGGDCEREILSALCEVQARDRACLVTWNGRCFDLPVVSLRALRHKIAVPWYYSDDVRHRYREAGHCDVMDVLSDHGAARNMKLGDVCRSIGLPGKVGDVRGSDVKAIVDAGPDRMQMSRVGRYCLDDALQTAILFVRTRFHEGYVGAADHDRAVASFRDAVVDVGDSPLRESCLSGVDWRALMVGT